MAILRGFLQQGGGRLPKRAREEEFEAPFMVPRADKDERS